VEWDAKELDRAVEGTEETDKISPIPTDLQARLEALVPEHLRSANQMHATLAFLYLRARLAPRGSGMNVVIRSALPVGAGLGSSASYAVVLSSGLLRIYKGAGRPVEEVNGWAFMAEKVIHGNPSGLDNTLCTYGGLLFLSIMFILI
jgi:mevalonate kinase